MMKPVLVRWRDSISGAGWRSRENWDKWLKSDGAIQLSVGFLFESSPDRVAIIQSVQEKDDPNMSEMLEIPRSAVISVRKLK